MATDYDKYPHYFKRIPEGLTHIDVYGVLRLFNVQSQEIGHAIKKLLVPGVRGSKSSTQDIQEAIDTLERWKLLNKEFSPRAAEHAEPFDDDLPKLKKKPGPLDVGARTDDEDSPTYKTGRLNKTIIVNWVPEANLGDEMAMYVVESNHPRFVARSRFDFGFMQIATKEGYTILSIPIAKV